MTEVKKLGRRIHYKRIISLIISVVMAVTTLIPHMAVSAEDTGKYPYTMFGRNGIEINTANFSVNGNVHTNKEAVINAQNKNINGKLILNPDKKP